MERKTEKITVSLPEDTLRIADGNREQFGFQNRSEFIDAAIREYVSRDLLKEFSGELAALYKEIEHSEIKSMEERLSKLSYKIAVEIAQANLLLMSLLDVSYTDMRTLRGKAVHLVNKNHGFVPLRDTVQNLMKIQLQEETYNGW